MSVSIYLSPDSDRERRVLDYRADKTTSEDDLFRNLPDDGIARKEWLDTRPDTEHKRIIPRSYRSNDSFWLVSDRMDLGIVFKNNLRNEALLCMIEIPEHIAESVADLITSESDRHTHLGCDTRCDDFFLTSKSIIQFPQESDSLDN